MALAPVGWSLFAIDSVVNGVFSGLAVAPASSACAEAIVRGPNAVVQWGCNGARRRVDCRAGVAGLIGNLCVIIYSSHELARQTASHFRRKFVGRLIRRFYKTHYVSSKTKKLSIIF